MNNNNCMCCDTTITEGNASPDKELCMECYDDVVTPEDVMQALNDEACENEFEDDLVCECGNPLDEHSMDELCRDCVTARVPFKGMCMECIESHPDSASPAITTRNLYKGTTKKAPRKR